MSQADSTFPCTGNCIGYGSFARKTKKRPLDDIDLMILLKTKDALGCDLADQPHHQRLYITSRAAPLAQYADENGYISSTRVLSKVKNSLSGISNYSKAEIKRNQQAITLNLTSYTWTFDIVPAAAVGDAAGNTVYYLIPNGTGNWMRTDPRSNAAKVTIVNQQHGNIILPLTRLLKYWNRRGTKP